MENDYTKTLEARHDEIWQSLQRVCEEETLQEIAELIEINLEIATNN